MCTKVHTPSAPPSLPRLFLTERGGQDRIKSLGMPPYRDVHRTVKEEPLDLSAITAPVQDELDATRAFLGEKLASAFDMFAHISHWMVGRQGKLLRPTVFFLSARSFGETTHEHVALAGALELIHAGSLAHDDVIDVAGLRRQAATIRARWGDTIAVLYGDFLLARAFAVLSATPLETARRLAPPLVTQVIEGEAMQHQARHDLDLSQADYIDIVRRKTASLFAAASRIGGASAGADEADQARLLTYGTELGVAYQILDDILDLTASEEETGKTVGTDLRSGRFTLPILLLRDALPGEEVRDKIRRAAENDDAPALEELIRLAAESGALSAAAGEAMQRLDAAAESVAGLPESACRRHLTELATHLKARVERAARSCCAAAPVAGPSSR